jgi:hypothetical protein
MARPIETTAMPGAITTRYAFGTALDSLPHMARRRFLSNVTRETLSLIEDEEVKGVITSAEASILQKYVASMFVAGEIESKIAPVTVKLNRKLEQLGSAFDEWVSELGR